MQKDKFSLDSTNQYSQNCIVRSQWVYFNFVYFCSTANPLGLYILVHLLGAIIFWNCFVLQIPIYCIHNILMQGFQLIKK